MNLREFLQISSVVILIIAVDSGFSNEDLEVKTPYGTYRGHVIKSRDGRELLSFKGIPFAQPPVGPLRFKEPMKLKESDEVVEANTESECRQIGFDLKQSEHNVMNNSKYIGSEDCLHLNIYRPKDVAKDKLLPVYFWIHGGGFLICSGSESWNGPRYLLDGNKDMVMVAINYRLGILGFLSANDVNLPGNLGLKDQSMALKWVNENIALFGGDPNSITIGGHSAGAASVAHHMHSKASRGLFHRAISQSGTADCPWALKSTNEARKIASRIISYLGCPSEPEEILECLQGLPVDKLLDSQESLKVRGTALIMNLVPVIEKESPTAFMTAESVARGSDVPWITGVTNEEALFIYPLLVLEDHRYKDMSIMKEEYKKLLPILSYYEGNSDIERITEQLKDFYFGGGEFRKDSGVHLVQLLSDRMFNHGLIVAARKHRGKVFMYKVSYRGKLTLAILRPKGLENEVSHGDEIQFLFPVDMGVVIPLRGKELHLSNTLLDMWYNFIVQGDPTPDNQLWDESEGGKKYLEFTNDGQTNMTSNMFQHRINFLDQLAIQHSLHDEL